MSCFTLEYDDGATSASLQRVDPHAPPLSPRSITSSQSAWPVAMCCGSERSSQLAQPVGQDAAVPDVALQSEQGLPDVAPAVTFKDMELLRKLEKMAHTLKEWWHEKTMMAAKACLTTWLHSWLAHVETTMAEHVAAFVSKQSELAALGTEMDNKAAVVPATADELTQMTEQMISLQIELKKLKRNPPLPSSTVRVAEDHLYTAAMAVHEDELRNKEAQISELEAAIDSCQLEQLHMAVSGDKHTLTGAQHRAAVNSKLDEANRAYLSIRAELKEQRRNPPESSPLTSPLSSPKHSRKKGAKPKEMNLTSLHDRRDS